MAPTKKRAAQTETEEVEESSVHRLVSRESDFGSSVTLFTLGAGPSGSSTLVEPKIEESDDMASLRRSPRKRVKREYNEDIPSLGVDIEDAVKPVNVAVSPLLALRSRLRGATRSSSSLVTRSVKEEASDAPIVKKEEDTPLVLIDDSDVLPKMKAEAGSTSRAHSSSPTKKKAKAIPSELATPHPAPANWEKVYDLIKDMRSRIVAPVDTMGCDQAQYKESDPRVCSNLVGGAIVSDTSPES